MKDKLNLVSRQLDKVKQEVIGILPAHLKEIFDEGSYISGGCIYSLYNDKEPKDFDFFLFSESTGLELRKFFLGLHKSETHNSEEIEKKVVVVHYNGSRIVVTKNAITIDGKYQIITRFYGMPREVVGQFDFMHNTYWHGDGEIKCLKDWSYLGSDALVYNEDRARDISGTIIRVHRFCERGMKITNSQMCKMLRKLREVGFTERENEIIDNGSSY